MLSLLLLACWTPLLTNSATLFVLQVGQCLPGHDFNRIDSGVIHIGNELDCDLRHRPDCERFVDGRESRSGCRNDIEPGEHCLTVDHDIKDPLPGARPIDLSELQIHCVRAAGYGELVREVAIALTL